MSATASSVGRNYDELAHWEVLNELIGRIYECVLHPELWNETLSRLTAALCPANWEAAFLLWEGTSPPRGNFIASSGLAAGVQEMYSAVYAGQHEWSRRLMPFKNGSVVDSDEIMSREEFAQTPIGRDFLLPWGIDRIIAVLLDRRSGERLGLLLAGPGEREVAELKRSMRILAPHMQRAVRISERITTLQLAAGAAKEAADSAPFAVISLDADLRILAANKRVELYEREGVVVVNGERFGFVSTSAQRKLVELAKASPPAQLAFRAIDKNDREHPVLAARIAAKQGMVLGGVVDGAALIVTIGSAPGETQLVEINRVAQWFGLTPAEARLALAIGQGSSLQEYAALRAVTMNSVRFLLKGVFRKTGAASQAQLVSMIARLPAD